MAGFDVIRGLFGSSARQAQAGHNFAPGGEPPPQPATPVGPSRWEKIGAGLHDIGAALGGTEGGAYRRVQDDYRKRAEKAKQDAEIERLKAMAAELYPDDPDAQFLFSMAPDKFVEQQLERRQPQIIEGEDGIYEIQGGKSKLLQKYEPAPEKLSFGWVRGPDGKLVPEPGGPADPNYIATTAGVRRDAVVKRPMPRTGGGGGSRKPSTHGVGVSDIEAELRRRGVLP